MKKLLALCLLFSCNVMQTEEKVFAAEQVEIVVVEVQRVLPLLDECKEDIDKLKKDARDQAEDIQKAKQEFGKKIQTFQTAAKTMTPKVRESKEQELQQEAMQIEQDEVNFQQEMQKNELKLQEKYIGKIRDFCRKQGWKIVIPIALYVAPEYDKTEEVIVALNKEYKREQDAKKAKNAQAKAVK